MLVRSTLVVANFAVALLTTRPAVAQPTAPATQQTAPVTTQDLQGLWDFEMRQGERTSPGFFALGPVDRAWAGSITMYLTNTLAIRALTVRGDSVTMVVASREGDVTFSARLSSDGGSMQGIVEYHGGALLPMTAVRRSRPVAAR